MSPLAKVFVVINLVLAVGVLAVNATLFSSREQFTKTIAELKDTQEKNANRHGQAIARLSGALSEEKTNNSSLDGLKAMLEQKNSKLEGELGDLRREFRESQSKINEKDTLIGVKEKQLLQKNQENSRLTQANEELMADSSDAMAKKTQAETARARAFLDLQNHQKELAEMRKEFAVQKLRHTGV